MSDEKHIVILGGGYGGVLAAKKLARKFNKDSDITITLVDKKPYHTMLTELHEVAAGRIPEDGIRINFNKIFAGRKVKIVMDEVTSINFEEQILCGKATCTKYDYLIIGTGSKPTFYGCKGAKENAMTLWSYEDAVKIKHHMLELFGKASVETNPIIRRRLLNFVVVGCGFTGIEMAGELAEWRKNLCQTFTIPEDEVKIMVVDLLDKILPAFDDKLIEKTSKRLKKLRVEVRLKSNIEEIQKDYIQIEGFEKIETNTVIWAAGVEGSDIVESLDEVKITKKARHRIECDKYLRAVNHEHVFVVGDNIYYIPEGEDKPVPQMVENAEHSAKTVARNLYATIKNKELEEYKPRFHGAMVSIGGRYGVTQINTKKNKYIYSGFIAMFIKHFINFVYFVQIAGFNKLWKYLMHEFFHVEDRRSFLGGHFAKRSPNFWLVPLRLFLGGMWLYEGIEKLQKILKDPNDIFLITSKLPISGASEVAGEVSEQWGEALYVPEFISNFVQGFMDIFFYTSAGDFTFMATIFQTLMVVAEIVVGLCLIGGLFTALASIVSVIMSLMIWTSGMAPFEILWFIFGGITMIGGSGSTFGMDYYVLPFLKKRWKKIGFVKKWYIYTE